MYFNHRQSFVHIKHCSMPIKIRKNSTQLPEAVPCRSRGLRGNRRTSSMFVNVLRKSVDRAIDYKVITLPTTDRAANIYKSMPNGTALNRLQLTRHRISKSTNALNWSKRQLAVHFFHDTAHNKQFFERNHRRIR